MKKLQVVLPLCALLVTSAATAAPAATSAGGFGASAGGVGGQTVGQAALAAREGDSGPYSYVHLGPVRRLTPGYRGPLSFRDRELLKFHELVLKLQKEDGGTLTADDRAYLQARLDSIESP